MQQGDLHTRRPQFTEAFHLVIKLYSLCSQICSIKDSTKGTYVWLFASLASSLYVNGEKSTLYKGLSFFRQRSVTSLGRVSRILFQQQQQGRRRAERDEIFMLIVAKLPTKEDKRHVMRSCQAVLS